MKKFKDFSLQMKLFSSLIVLFIIPVSTLFLLISFFLNNAWIESNYYNSLFPLNATIKNTFVDILDTCIESMDELSQNKYINAVIAGKNMSYCYEESDQLLTTFCRRLDACHSTSLSDAAEIRFQRGDNYLVESSFLDFDPSFLPINPSISISPIHNLKYYQGKQINSCPVVTLITPVYDYSNMVKIGTININISIEKLVTLLTLHSSSSITNILVDEKKDIIISDDDESPLEEFRLSDFDLSTKESGSEKIKTKDGKSAAIVYQKCDNYPFYVVTINRTTTFPPVLIYIILALFFSILFGISFCLIQQKYIIKPLSELKIQLEKVDLSRIEISSSANNQDEIGRISQSIEQMLNRLNTLVNDNYIAQIKLEEAQRSSLLAQMNPHFLYNTLDSIRWVAIKNNDFSAADQLMALSDMMRYILRSSDPFVPVEAELSIVNDYLRLLQLRFPNRIRFSIFVDDTCRDSLIPKLCIQPLIENAWHHGLEKTGDSGGTILLSIRGNPNYLYIDVIDNGIGGNVDEIEERLRTPGDHYYAIKNIRERVSEQSDSHCGLILQSSPDGGMAIHIICRNRKDTNQ